MLHDTWGLLGPEQLSGTRRARSLGLAATVRLFNELAVPGLGGIWFGKQVMLASLGLTVAELARGMGAKVANIEVANAIEALACRLAFDSNGWNRDARLRGNSKLQGRGSNYAFSRVKQRNFYVTQPMRMSTVQALPSLGFAQSDSARFNAFQSTEIGREFLEEACREYRPYKRSIQQYLALWVCGREDQVHTGALSNALSPLKPLPRTAGKLLNEGLRQGFHESAEGRLRRINALDWVNRLWRDGSRATNWLVRPPEIMAGHWHDLHAGAVLFAVRDAAISTLDSLEFEIGNHSGKQSYRLNSDKVPTALAHALELLSATALKYLELEHNEPTANSFCQECRGDHSMVLRCLVERDGQVLRLVGDEIKPGAAFRGASPAEEEASFDVTPQPQASVYPLPTGISYRVRNLFQLNLDLHGKLDGWLKSQDLGTAQ